MTAGTTSTDTDLSTSKCNINEHISREDQLSVSEIKVINRVHREITSYFCCEILHREV